MTSSTIKAVEDFADAVSELAQGCYHMVGEDTVVKVLKRCEELKRAVKHEESQANDT